MKNIEKLFEHIITERADLLPPFLGFLEIGIHGIKDRRQEGGVLIADVSVADETGAIQHSDEG